MLHIFPIPALSDNYIWIIRQGNEAVIIDPADEQSVIAVLERHQLTPIAILLTHNHRDHTDGVAGLCQIYTNLTVIGPNETAAFNHQTVQHGERFLLLGHQFEVINSAGHTAGHISYLMDMTHLFCGDSLFSAGCGRVFTGDYAAQFETLQRFKALPDMVKVYAGHEYTVSNLKFAEAVLAPSCALFEHLELAQLKRNENRPTLPSSIGIEMQINPFLKAETLDEFIALRQHKDRF